MIARLALMAATPARLRVVVLASALLTTCGQDLVQVSIGRCWKISPGDRIEGTAELFAVSDNADCVECPSSLSGGAQCDGYGLILDNAIVRANYERLKQSAPPDDMGFVHPSVFLAGKAEHGHSGGPPLIRVTRLRAPPTARD